MGKIRSLSVKTSEVYENDMLRLQTTLFGVILQAKQCL